jgi:hypothetical protein
MMESMGIVFIGLILMILGSIVCYAVFKIFAKSVCVKKVMRFLAKKIMFNFFVRSFIAGYLVFALSSFRNVKSPDFTTGANGFSTFCAIIICLICYVSPFVSMLFLLKK